jgi:hypothetical protein
MKRIVFIAICLFGLTVAVHAQMGFTVNGLSPDNTYTLAQMKACFGNNPSSEIISVSNDSETTYCLEYGDDYFEFSTDFGWTIFVLETNTYPVVANGVTFRVGDNLSALSAILNGLWVLKSTGLYYLYLPPMDDPIEIEFNSSNIITSISFSASI